MLHRVAQRLVRQTMPRASVCVSTSVRSFGSGGYEIHPRVPETPKNPGGPDRVIPTWQEHATGEEYNELKILEETKGLLHAYRRGAIEGQFGTFSKPALVQSSFPSRVVGCVGAGERSHELVWFDLKANNKKHLCQRCGQVFKLVNPEQVEELLNDKNMTTEEENRLWEYLTDADEPRNPTEYAARMAELEKKE